MCVNDLVVQGAEPLFFLDYLGVGRLDPRIAEPVVAGIAEGCRRAGCALIGGETAEMPGMYAPGDYDLAGFAVGAVERDRLVDGTRVGEGDVVLGLPSSGPHSNGFSLIRKVLERAGGIDACTDRARALLAPTRIYVDDVLPLLSRFDVRAMAHVTGGGLAENLERVLPSALGGALDPEGWTVPESFEWLQATGNIEPAEMRRTFNLGIGFVLVVPADESDALRADLAERTGTECTVIGEIVARGDDRARVRFGDE